MKLTTTQIEEIDQIVENEISNSKTMEFCQIAAWDLINASNEEIENLEEFLKKNSFAIRSNAKLLEREQILEDIDFCKEVGNEIEERVSKRLEYLNHYINDFAAEYFEAVKNGTWNANDWNRNEDCE